MIEEGLADLFERWKRRRNTKFVEDGIVHEDTWRSLPVRIMWVLKDNNTSLERPRALLDPLRQFIGRSEWPTETSDWADEELKPSNWTFWPNVLRHSYGIQHHPCSYPDANTNFRASGVWRGLGALNLKKEPGMDSVHTQTIAEVARVDRDLIVEELEICDPTVIVCGGTFEILCKQVLERPMQRDWAHWGNRIIVKGQHPSSTRPTAYDELMRAYAHATSRGQNHV